VGFRFRKSVRVLPGLRLNFSKSGTSVSLGRRGLHYTIGPTGSRTTVSMPGTGLSWTDYRSDHQSHSRPTSLPSALSNNSQPWPALSFDQVLSPIESKTGQDINAFSTSQLAPILNTAHRRIRSAPLLFFASGCLFAGSLVSQDQLLVGLSALYATALVPISIFLDRYRRSVRVSLGLSTSAEAITSVLAESFASLTASRGTWSVRAEGRTSDWKRNAGATTLNRRAKILLKLSRPSCIRGKLALPSIDLGNTQIFFLPDAVLVTSQASIAALHYRDVEFYSTDIRFIEESRLPSDARIVGHTWRFVNKDGGPDRRFNSNRQLPVCLYGEMGFSSLGGLKGKMQYSNFSAGEKFAKALQILIKHGTSSADLSPFASYQDAKRWPTLTFGLIAILLGISLTVIVAQTIRENSIGAIHGYVPTDNRNLNKDTSVGDLKDSSTTARPTRQTKKLAPPPLDILPKARQQ
jgi:hypothetical protein